MAALLVPIALLFKNILREIGGISYLNSIPLYLYFIIVLFSGIIKKRNFPYQRTFNIKIFIGFLIFIVLQFLAMIVSHYQIGNNELNKNPIKQWFYLCLFVSLIYIHYMVMIYSIQSKNDIKRFLQGIFIACLIFLVSVYLQLGYLILPNLFKGIVQIIGTLFEYRFERDWYDAGSYVQTLHRINGFNPEASYMAAQASIVFIPFIMAAIKNRFNIFFINKPYKSILYVTLLLLFLFILLMAKTTTGIVLGLAVITLLWFSLKFKRKYIMLVLIILIGGTSYFLFLKDSLIIREILNKYLYDKASDGSTLNRQGSMIALATTTIHHCITGVGWKYHDYYIFKYVPDWTKANWEYHYEYALKNYYPILSIWLGWLAEFGVICVTLLVVYIYKLLRDLITYSKNDKKNPLKSTLKDAAIYFIIMYFIASIFVFDWSQTIYLIIFFFFVVIRQLIKKGIIMGEY